MAWAFAFFFFFFFISHNRVNPISLISYNSHHKSWVQGGRTALAPKALFFTLRLLCTNQSSFLQPPTCIAHTIGRVQRGRVHGILAVLHKLYQSGFINRVNPEPCGCVCCVCMRCMCCVCVRVCGVCVCVLSLT